MRKRYIIILIHHFLPRQKMMYDIAVENGE